MQKQHAIVVSPNVSLEYVQDYLPHNYNARLTGGRIIIEGEDDAGWTLDGYVIPRLTSALVAVSPKKHVLDDVKGALIACHESLARGEWAPTAAYRRLLFGCADLCRIIGLEPPTDDDIAAAVEEMSDKRLLKKGQVRKIKNPRGECGDLFKFWLDWHAGRTGGSLWGVMMRRGDLSDRFDSLAQVYRTVCGAKRPSEGARMWASVLGLDQNKEAV
jgi:hypothetical protein